MNPALHHLLFYRRTCCHGPLRPVEWTDAELYAWCAVCVLFGLLMVVGVVDAVLRARGKRGLP